MKISKKSLAWLLIIVLAIAWGIQKNNTNQKIKKEQLALDKLISEEYKLQAEANLKKNKRSFYLNSICKFKDQLSPVSEVLVAISERRSIPPDLLPELIAFNELAQLTLSDDSFFLEGDEELINYYPSLSTSLSAFTKELNLKTVELEQGYISASNKYFASLNDEISNLVRPACEIYFDLNPDLGKTSSSTPEPKVSNSAGYISKELEKIGKQVNYEALCKLKTSSNSFDSALENVKRSTAFKNALLEYSKELISDLGYVAFVFSDKGLNTATQSDLIMSKEIQKIKLSLEKYRYGYWSNSSNSNLKLMQSLSQDVKEFGNIGCVELENIKKS